MSTLINKPSLSPSRVIATLLCTFFCATVGVAQDLEIENYNLVHKKRVSRVEFDYTYTAQVRNAGPDYQNVMGTLASNSPYTRVITGELNFGDVASGDTALSQNTFTIRQNRRYGFSWGNLLWQFSHDEVVGDTFWVGPEGGTYSDIYGTVISIPSGALTENRMISVLTHLSMATLSAPGPHVGGALFGPSGLVFTAPISVTFSLDQEYPPGTELPIFTFDDEKAAWSATEFLATVNTDRSSATAQLTHFTDYIIMGGEWAEIFGAFLEPFSDTCILRPLDELYDRLVARASQVFPIGDEKAWDFSAHYPSWGYGCYAVNGIQFVLSATRSRAVPGGWVLVDELSDSRLVGSEGSSISLIFQYPSQPIESSDSACGEYQLAFSADIDVKLTPSVPEATLEVAKTNLCIGEDTNVKATMACGDAPYKDQLVSFESGSGSISPDEGVTDGMGVTPVSVYTAELEGVDDIKGRFDAWANMPITGGDTIIDYVPVTVEQCIDGAWHLSPITQYEECQQGAGGWYPEDEFAGFDVDVEVFVDEDEDDAVITASYIPDVGLRLSGNWDRDTGAFDLAVNTSDPSQCGYLFFWDNGADMCGEAVDCRFEACRAITNIEGLTATPVDGSVDSLDAESNWYLGTTFSFANGPGTIPPRGTNTYECRGNAMLSGSR